MYTLDTNVVIYYTRGDADVVVLLEELYARNAPIFVSAATEAELFAYSRLEAGEIAAIDNFLQTVGIIPIDSHIARSAGSLQSKYGLRLGDALIAATAIFTSTTLLTRNIRDFRRVVDLQVEKV